MKIQDQEVKKKMNDHAIITDVLFSSSNRCVHQDFLFFYERLKEEKYVGEAWSKTAIFDPHIMSIGWALTNQSF